MILSADSGVADGDDNGLTVLQTLLLAALQMVSLGLLALQSIQLLQIKSLTLVDEQNKSTRDQSTDTGVLVTKVMNEQSISHSEVQQIEQSNQSAYQTIPVTF